MTGHLPETDSKGQPRTETIKNVKITKRTDAQGNPVPYVFQIPAEKFVYPMFSALQDAVNDATSEEILLNFINQAVAARAVAKAKNFIRSATESAVGEAGNYEDVVSRGLEICSTFSINEPEELSTKAKASTFDELAMAAKSGTLSPEEIAERLKALTL